MTRGKHQGFAATLQRFLEDSPPPFNENAYTVKR
jgi:hypothetical protein